MKNKLLSLLVAAALCLNSGLLAYAADGEDLPLTTPPVDVSPSPTPMVTPSPAPVPAKLSIDTGNRYPGMNQSYSQGYAPVLDNGSVQIVIPILSSGPLQGNTLKASLLIPEGSSPIVAASYEKQVILSHTAPLGGGPEQDVYLVEFAVPLSDSRENGVYPLKVLASATDAQGSPVTGEYTVYVTIDDVAPPPTEAPPPPPPGPSGPSAEPVIYISGYTMSPEVAYAGEEFALTLTLKNSLSSKTVSNLMVTVEPKDLKMTLLEPSNVIPLGRVKPNGEVELVLHFRPDGNITEDKHVIDLRFDYNTGTSMNLSAKGTCIIDVRQPAELRYSGASLPVKVFQGEPGNLSMSLMNTGKSTVYNCFVDFAVEGLSVGGSVFVGEIAPGGNQPVQVNFRVDTELMGEVQGAVTLHYEDAFGEEYTEEITLSTVIQEKPLTEEEQKEAAKGGSHLWWLYLLLGLGLGGGAAYGIPKFIADRKQRQEDDLRL